MGCTRTDTRRKRVSLGLVAALSCALIVAACGGKQTVRERPFEDDFPKADYPPELVYMEKPVYPEEARKSNFEGEVHVAMIVDERGYVERAKIWESSDSIFNESAMAAAKRCRFKPAILKGQPVRAGVLIPFHFRLH
jgi:TonB family protein